jgi:PPOX class probable F420-dependent enzyme
VGVLTMTKAEREEFLAGLHVGLLCVAAGADQAPVVAPVWYAYEPGGDVVLLTHAEGEKTPHLRAAARASFCVQTEELPYKYVTVEGPVVVSEEHDADRRREIAERYLGPELAAGYLASTADTENVTVRITPDRWRTVDFMKQFG